MGVTGDALVVTSGGANVRTLSAPKPAGNGVVVGVSASANPAAPRGRIYARVCVTTLPPSGVAPSAAQLEAALLAVLWSGYVTPGCPTSFPAYPLPPGATLVADFVEGSNGAATDVLRFALDIRPDYARPSHPFYEAPNDGRGEIYAIVIPAPAEGTDIGSPTAGLVPAFVRWSLLGFGSGFGTSAVAGNRLLFVSVKNAGGVEVAGGCANMMQGPSLGGTDPIGGNAIVYRFSAGAGCISQPTSGSEAMVPQQPWTVNGIMPSGQFPTGYQVEWITRNFDNTPITGDNWTQSRLYVEEFASFIP